MNIQQVSVDKLKAAAYNPRKQLKPGDAEYEKLKRSITEFGYVEPVIWNKTTGRVVGGHQRLKVLMDMGYTEVDCVVVELTEEKEKAELRISARASAMWFFKRKSKTIQESRKNPPITGTRRLQTVPMPVIPLSNTTVITRARHTPVGNSGRSNRVCKVSVTARLWVEQPTQKAEARSR